MRTEYEKLQTQYENITANGQPRGAAGFRGYPIWYKLMVELLHKYLWTPINPYSVGHILYFKRKKKWNIISFTKR